MRIQTIASIAAATAIVLGLSSMNGHAAQQAPAAAAPAPAPAGDAEKGKQIFNKVGCYECHGREGQGSAYTGPRLGPNPLPFAAFSKYVRSPKGEMPPFKAQILSDAALADIYAFLRSRPRGASIDAYFAP